MGVGTIGGMFGLGGGILLMPVLRFGFCMPASLAVGTCIMGICCTTLTGSYYHHRLGHINIPSLMPVMFAGVLAAAVCSLLFGRIAGDTSLIDFCIGVVFLFVAIRMIRAGLRKRQGKPGFLLPYNKVEGPIWGKAVIGGLAGALPGLFGIGGGSILVPAFTIILNAPIKVAMGSSLACYTVNAFVSFGFKWYQGYVDFGLAIPICFGVVLGSGIGARLNKRTPSSSLKTLFGLMFLYVALKFILSSLGIKI